MKKQKQPIRLLHTWIKGAVGHEFVIKHYKYGPVKTKFPDMTRIIAFAQQRKCRNIFKEAVAYAKTVYADPIKKKEWTSKSRKKHRVFNYIIKEYMLAAKQAANKRQEIGTIIIRKCFPHYSQLRNRITNVEATVVPQLNQGTNPGKGCNLSRGSFFGSFLEKQKRTKKNISTVVGEDANNSRVQSSSANVFPRGQHGYKPSDP